MRVFLAPAPALVPPLDAPARDVVILDRTLGETMERELRSVGLEIVPVASLEEGESRARQEPEGAFVLLDSVLASRQVLRRFVKLAPAQGPGAVVCALPKSLGNDFLSHVEGLDPRAPKAGGDPVWTAPFYFLRGPSGSLAGAEPLVLPYKEQVLRFPVPVAVLGKPEHVVGMSQSYLCNVSHWVHVLRLNTAAIAGWWFERLHWGVVLGPLWIAWRLLSGFPWIGGRLAGGLRSVSALAQVHHSAHIEVSIVKKKAVIGAHTSIRNSFIDEGAMIGDGARIFGSVIGKGAFVATNSIVFGSVVYPEAFAAQQIMQASILGRRSCVLAASWFFDVNFFRNIRVSHRGKLVDSGTQFLGVAVGPQTRVGAGVWVGSGREIPSGALVVKPTDEVITRIGPVENGVPYTVREGELVKLGAG